MKVYLIDSANNNRVVDDFESKKEGLKYLKIKFNNSSINESWKEYREDFFFVPLKQMKKAIRKSGSGVRRYYV